MDRYVADMSCPHLDIECSDCEYELICSRLVNAEVELAKCRGELAELAKAKAEGRLVELPAALGQRLWQVYDGEIIEWAVDMVQMMHSGDAYIGCVDIVYGGLGEDYEHFDAACIGSKLRLTRKAAEAALEGSGVE